MEVADLKSYRAIVTTAIITKKYHIVLTQNWICTLMEHQGTNPHSYCHLILGNGVKTIYWRKDNLLSQLAIAANLTQLRVI